MPRSNDIAVVPTLLEALAHQARRCATHRQGGHPLHVRVEDLRGYTEEPRWYQSGGAGEEETLPKTIAYFSPEYGITAVLPQYSGGLGILAGDHLKSASDLGVPIIGVGFNQANPIEKVAKEFPKVHFTLIDGVVKLPNVQSVLFKEHEGSFLVGLLAAMASKSGKIGFVGGMVHIVALANRRDSSVAKQKEKESDRS